MPTVEEVPAPGPAEAPPVSVTPRKRAAKPTPTPAFIPTAPKANPQAEQILKLQTLARDAYAKQNYAEPPAANAISYAKQVLALDPDNDCAKRILEDSVNGGKYQIQEAVAGKDFTGVRRIADAMAKLLPEQRDVVELKEDIASAERADQAPPPPKAPTPHRQLLRVPSAHGQSSCGRRSLLHGQPQRRGGTLEVRG